MSHVHLPLTPAWLWWPYPWVWALALLALVPILWVLWLRPRRRAVLRFSSLQAVRAAGGGARRHARLLLPLLRTVALVGLIVAVARPQVPNESRRVMVEGVAIQMVLDTSTSMRDRDLSPRGEDFTRLDVVKDVFRRFVLGDGRLPGRPDDLIGMLRFAKYADSVCPLTLDRDALMNVLDETRLVLWQDELGRWHGDQEEDGTAIGDALALAVERLKDLKRTTGSGEQLVIKSRVVVLLTDGENNQGMIMPRQAGDLAATYGIKVYTILAGTGQARGFLSPSGREVITGRLPVNDEDLKYIAEVSGGRHFRADNRAALEQIYAEIDTLERTRTEEHRYVEWGELAWSWLMLAFACLSLQTLLDATLLRKIP